MSAKLPPRRRPDSRPRSATPAELSRLGDPLISAKESPELGELDRLFFFWFWALFLQLRPIKGDLRMALGAIDLEATSGDPRALGLEFWDSGGLAGFWAVLLGFRAPGPGSDSGAGNGDLYGDQFSFVTLRGRAVSV